MTEDEVTELLRAYGLRVMVVRPLSGGMENTHLYVETPDDVVVATVLRKKSLEDAEHYAYFLRDLALAGAPVPRLRRRLDGSWVASHGGHPVVVCDFVGGRHYSVLSPRLVELAGTVLGRVHRTAAHVRCALPPHMRLNEHETALLSDLSDNAFAQWARTTLREVGYVTEQHGSIVPTHADVFPDNIIFAVADRPDDLVFIDWEDGSLDFPTMDIGMALLGLCCPGGFFSPPRARRLLYGYRIGSGASLDFGLVKDTARYAAVVVALRRYQWRRAGRKPADRTRSHTALPHAVLALERSWPEVTRR